MNECATALASASAVLMSDISRRFGAVHALTDVDFALASPMPPPERALEGVYEEGARA